MFRKLLSRLFPYFEKLGIHVLPVHYYSPIPEIGKLREEIWQRVSELPGINVNEEIQLKLLEQFEKYSDEFNSFPLQKGDGFYVSNPSFGAVDAEIYYCMIRHFRPRKIIEVGAGFSTLLAAETVERNAIDCEIVAIDPYPQKFLKANKRIKVVEKPVEEVGLEEFKALGENDILFIDSTHTLKMGGDVVYLYLEVLPRLWITFIYLKQRIRHNLKPNKRGVTCLRVLITGHTGFIGRNLVKYFHEKVKFAEVIGFSRSEGLNVLDYEQILKCTKDVDIVYHLAAYAKPAESVVNPVEAVEVNIKGTLNVLEACRRNNFMLIYPSTCEIYGDSKEPIREDSPINPPNPYAASKAACDRLCYTYSKAYKLDIKIVRLFNPYGPHQQLNKIIPTFYAQAKANKPITVYGDGSDTRDYVYIDDIVEGLWLARLLPAGEVVNLATGKATSNLEMVLLIKDLLKSQSPIVFTEYPKPFGGIRYQVGCYDKAKKLMGWEPKVSLKDGVERTIAWLETLG